MTTLADRLRGIVRTTRPAVAVSSDDAAPGLAKDAAADALGGTWQEANGHRFLVVDRSYLAGHRHGRVPVADVLPPDGGAWPGLSLLGVADSRSGATISDTSAESRRGMLFLDLETTGLAGGAGTYAFLVGCAWFDGGVLRVRQWFLSSFSAERALLTALAEVARSCATVVTYNGKTFDVPLLDTRYTLHRLETPFAEMPHVDMLHSARRLWRGEDDEAAGTTSSCKLTLLEETLLGHVREGDVPGFEIPGRYFHYVHSGDARPLEPVLEHNRLDLVSLAFLTARAASLLEQGAAQATTGREALGLGRLYERADRTTEAMACYARAAGIDDGAASCLVDAVVPPKLKSVDWLTRAHALRDYALLARRGRRFDQAAIAWERIVELRRCPANITQQAVEALAIHHEHRRRDPRAARTLALRSLAHAGSASRRVAAEHRLARLERKLGDPAPREAALF